MLTIGQWEYCPSPPTWREFFISEGIAHTTEDDVPLQQSLFERLLTMISWFDLQMERRRSWLAI